MQQRKLDSFFKITINHNERNKKCFIYDPENYKAFFATKPLSTDIFIVNKSGVKLYYRYMKPKDIKFPIIDADYCVPLLKSNLQKAVRRCENQIAIQTSLAILQKEPMELLRRLPIIYIEDVCLMDSYPIAVWLMMADKDYIMTTTDIDIILNIVNSLCNCREYFDFRGNDNVYNFSHELLQDYENFNELLTIYYRSEYGGMKGDMQMLKTSIEYYINNPMESQKTVFNSINYDKIKPDLEILVEAIDFHPFPEMLNTLSRITKIDKQIIKQCIWFVESGYNIRKPFTIESSKLYEERSEWRKIECYLDDIRSDLINN
jgi:hypothetical protein